MNDPFVPVNALETLLMRAATVPAVRADFYRELCVATLFVLTPDVPEREGTRTLEKAEQVGIVNWSTADGKPYVPVFSSEEKMQEVVARGAVAYGTLGFPGKTLMEMLIQGSVPAILNPGLAYGKELVPDEMRRLATGGMFEPVKHEVVKAERQILIGQPKEYPNELVRALKALFEKRSVVEAAYRAHFFDPSTGDPPHLLVALKLAREDRALMADAGIVATEAGEKGKLVDFMVLSGRAGVEGYFQSIEPFYRRSVEILKPPEKKTGWRRLFGG